MIFIFAIDKINITRIPILKVFFGISSSIVLHHFIHRLENRCWAVLSSRAAEREKKNAVSMLLLRPAPLSGCLNSLAGS